jgi:hypothetical protein
VVNDAEVVEMGRLSALAFSLGLFMSYFYTPFFWHGFDISVNVLHVQGFFLRLKVYLSEPAFGKQFYRTSTPVIYTTYGNPKPLSG